MTFLQGLLPLSLSKIQVSVDPSARMSFFSSLSINPSYLSSLLGRPGGRVQAEDLFSGNADVYFSQSNQLEGKKEGSQEFGLELDIDDVDLKKALKVAKRSFPLPISPTGKASVQGEVYVDPSFKAQPKADLNINLKTVDVPASNIPLNLGGGVTMGLALPGFKLKAVDIKGNLIDRKLTIQEGKIGDAADPLSGKITGDVFLSMFPGGRVTVDGYDIKLNLSLSEQIHKQLGVFLTIVDGYQNIGKNHKFATIKGVRYSMRLTAKKLTSPPKVSKY